MKFNSQGFSLIHQYGRRFFVLDNKYGHCDVMWKRSTGGLCFHLARQSVTFTKTEHASNHEYSWTQVKSRIHYLPKSGTKIDQFFESPRKATPFYTKFFVFKDSLCLSRQSVIGTKQ